MKSLIKSQFFILAACFFIGCGGSAAMPEAPPITIVPPAEEIKSIPRLVDGPHLGYIVGFDVLNAQRADRAEALQQTALDNGVSIGRVQLDWRDLEPEPGVFDRDLLREALAASTLEGLSVMMTLSTLDSGTFTLPDDFMTDDGGNIRPGLRLDDAEVTDRLKAFLDWLAPELESHDVWGLSLGNEVESNFEIEGLEEQALGFLTVGLKHLKVIDPELAATVTMTSTVDLTHAEFSENIIQNMDFVTLNYYCLTSELTVSPPEDWSEDFERMANFADGKDIFFQELGCPVGYRESEIEMPPNTRIGGDLDTQAAFFEFTLGRIADDDRFRAATLFQLYDWSPELTKSFSEDLFEESDEDETEAILRVQEWLATIGLCKWSDTLCRPAWEVVLEAARDIKAQRP